jgi:hypothetical protein
LDEEGRLTNGAHAFDIGYVVEDATGSGDSDEKRIAEKLKEIFPDGDAKDFWPMVGLIKTMWGEHIFEGMKTPQPHDKAWHDRWWNENAANYIDCPKCPAAQGERCVSASRKRTATHVSRIKAGREADKNPSYSKEEVQCTREGCTNMTEIGSTSERRLKTIICRPCFNEESREYLDRLGY